ncbi:MAG: hypothetical protein IOD05_05085 [Rhodobacter sp.]|nr:hypothetical protein [Rhodobacter sp.]
MSDDYSPAVALMATQMEAKSKIREQWKLDGGNLIDAHQFAFSSVASMIGRFSRRKFPEQVRAVEGRMSLTACLMTLVAPARVWSQCPPRHSWRALAAAGSLDARSEKDRY